MFDNIRNDPMYRRLYRWAGFSAVVYLYVTAFDLIFGNEFQSWKYIILFPVTIGFTGIWTLISYGYSKSRCTICQKTIDELEQPTNSIERNRIRDYCLTHVQLCDECLVDSYYGIFGIEGRIKEIEKTGLTQFYKELKDKHTDFSKTRPKKI